MNSGKSYHYTTYEIVIYHRVGPIMACRFEMYPRVGSILAYRVGIYPMARLSCMYGMWYFGELATLCAYNLLFMVLGASGSKGKGPT